MTSRFPVRLTVDEFATINRRNLLRGLGATALVTATGGLFSSSVWGTPVFAAYPFALGVASGDPAPDGFVIWTKIAPKPLEHGGGMPKQPVEVDWMVASDERMQRAVHKGTAIAHPELGHAVHVEVAGLEPARDYFYRFVIGGERSAIGRARTLPRAGAPLAQLRFGVAGCQRYEAGFYTAYRHIAEERFDFVYHYGDYIYEYRSVRPGELAYPVVRVMPGEPDECYTLDEYRHRYSLHQLDLDLQAAHASAPFIMSFDDHEVDNDWAGDVWKKTRRPNCSCCAARRRSRPGTSTCRCARRNCRADPTYWRTGFAVGDLMAMNVLDTRQFRTTPPCGDGVKAIAPKRWNPTAP